MNTVDHTTIQQRFARKLLIASVVPAFIISFIFDWNMLGIQFSLSIVLVVFSYLWLQRSHAQPLRQYIFLLIAFAVSIAVFVPIRETSFLTLLNVVAPVWLLLVAAVLSSKIPSLGILDYLFVSWLLPIISLPASRAATKFAHVRSGLLLNNKQKHIIRGSLIALPLIIIFGLLFASADAIFANLAGSIFDFGSFNLSGVLIARLVAWALLFTLFSGILGYVFLYEQRGDADTAKAVKKASSPIEVMIILGSINILFAVFLIIQAVYLFGGQSFVIDSEITYAEYGRQGFFQLLAVSVLVYALIFGIRYFYTSKENRLPLYLCIGLIAQVGVVMVSALRRLGLYEEVFGFTLLRFYAHSFIFFLAVLFGFLMYALIKRHSEDYLLRSIVFSFAGFLLMLNLVNPDSFIARQNLDRYQETGKIDVSYIAGLSGDAVHEKAELVSTLASDSEELRDFRDAYCSYAQYRSSAEGGTWSTWHVSRDSTSASAFEQSMGCVYSDF